MSCWGHYVTAFRFRRSRDCARCTLTGSLWEYCSILLWWRWDRIWNKNSESLCQHKWHVSLLHTVGACKELMCVCFVLAVAATRTLQAILMVVGKEKPAQVWRSFPQVEFGWNQRNCFMLLYLSFVLLWFMAVMKVRLTVPVLCRQVIAFLIHCSN